MILRRCLAPLLLGAGYFLLAGLAVSLTRFDGGVAFIWPAGSLLIAALFAWRRSRWPGALAACGVASFLVTGLFGLGWGMALPFVLVNLVEAVVAASLLRPARRDQALSSSNWLLTFVLAAGVAGPIAGGALAAAFATTAHLAPVPIFLNFFAGHALGNLTFIPLMLLLVDRQAAQSMRLPHGRTKKEAAILLALVALTTAAAFWQRAMPLLFLPFLPVIMTAFRAGRVGAAIAIAIIALIGGTFTLAGRGPIHLFDASSGAQMQFLQFYLATIVLTVLPVAVELKRRAELHRKLRESESRYRMVADHSSDILMQCAADGRLTYVSPAIRQLGGYDPAQLVGKSVLAMIAPADRAAIAEAHLAMIAEPETRRSFEYRALTADGRQRWFESSAQALVDADGRAFATLSVVRDIQARKDVELKLQEAALTDSLTGLPNRRAFREAAERLLAERTLKPACIAMFDVDHFKRVNDTHGHDGGDAVLRHIAAVARAQVRQSNLVARLGGEEFALLLAATDIDQALGVCERLRRAVAEDAVDWNGERIAVTVSGGVARLNERGLDHALKRADLALYEAKAGGRDQLALAA